MPWYTDEKPAGAPQARLRPPRRGKAKTMMKLLYKKKPPRRAATLSALCLVALLLYALARVPLIAERVFAQGVTRWLSFALNRLTNFIPVSFYELIAAFLVAGGAFFLVSLVVFAAKKEFARAGLWLYRAAVAALFVLLAFGVLYAPLYARAHADEALGLTTDVTPQSLYAAAEYYVDALNETSARLERDADGNVLPTCGFGALADRLNARYAAFEGNYFADFEVRAKAVLLSVPMSYLGITGIYFPFTAEANVNVNIPAYELPATMAHEMAHAKGVSRENEANIVSYAVCILSEDDYIRYSGLMNAAAILVNALPEEQYETLAGRLDEKVLREYANARAHYEKYEGFIDSVSSFFNDLFLKANGVPSGTASYGETEESLVALYEKIVNS